MYRFGHFGPRQALGYFSWSAKSLGQPPKCHIHGNKNERKRIRSQQQRLGRRQHCRVQCVATVGPTKTHTNTKAPKETTTKPQQRRRRRRHRRIRIRRRARRHPKLLAPQSTTKSTAQKIAFGTCSAAGCL